MLHSRSSKIVLKNNIKRINFHNFKSRTYNILSIILNFNDVIYSRGTIASSDTRRFAFVAAFIRPMAGVQLHRVRTNTQFIFYNNNTYIFNFSSHLNTMNVMSVQSKVLYTFCGRLTPELGSRPVFQETRSVPLGKNIYTVNIVLGSVYCNIYYLSLIILQKKVEYRRYFRNLY